MRAVRADQQLPFKVKKRVSDEYVTPSQLKRHQPLGASMQQTAALDNIPVRSVSFPTSSYSARSSESRHPSISGRALGRTDLSSIHSSFTASTIFSAASEAQTSFTSVAESFVESSYQDRYAPCTQEKEALHGCFANFDAPLTESYQIEWPSWNFDCLDGASYGHLWEFARLKAGLIDGVNHGNLISDIGNYGEDNPQWLQCHSQSKFRALFSTAVDLPPPSDNDAWKASLAGCSKDDCSVVFSGHLSRSDTTGNVYSFTMYPLKMERTYRLQRHFGADRFMEITISRRDVQDPEQFAKWIIGGIHYFLGRRWMPFFVKDATERRTALSPLVNGQRAKVDQKLRIYFFAAFGDEFRGDTGAACERSDIFKTRPNIAMSEFLRWALDIGDNLEQTVCKLFSRISLNLTRATATVELLHCQILPRRDVVSATNEVMTDGIGRMSRSLCSKVSRCLNLHPSPSAFQARIGGAKGIWIVDMSDDSDEDWLEVLPSQTKWICNSPDNHQRIFEVVSWSKPLTAGELSLQLVPILENGAVDSGLLRSTLKKLLKDTLTEDFNLNQSVVNEPLPLRSWINSTKLKTTERSKDSMVPFAGSLPTAMSDQALFLLDSGFNPSNNARLRQLVSDLAKQRWDHLEERMRISIPCSTVALMVADFTGLLKEGEVHLSFSTEFDAGQQFCDTLLEELDVLVARNPAHLPSDIQKVRAVSIQQLRGLKDIIVFSTKGNTPLASLLSGGDYDGDKAWVCWDQDIVKNFQPSPLPPRPEIMHRMTLRKDKTTVAELSGFDNDEFLYRGLAFNLQSSMLGICTNYKERLCYKYNTIANDKAISLSYLLSDLVDQAKQGTIFTEADWQRFRKDVLDEADVLLQPNYQLDPCTSSNRIIWKENETHILDDLRAACTKVVGAARQAIAHALPPEQTRDPDLTAMYKSFDSDSNPMWREILLHVRRQNEVISAMWTRHMNHTSNTRSDDMKRIIYQSWLDIKPLEKYRTLPEVQVLLQPWAKDQSMTEWTLLKASALHYRYDKRVNFVWTIAARQLAALKRQQQNGIFVTVSPEIYPFLKPDKKRIATLYDSHDSEDE